jgi:hypothetical protein
MMSMMAVMDASWENAGMEWLAASTARHAGRKGRRIIA